MRGLSKRDISEKISIGVMGTTRGVGVTHLSIAIANYTASVLGKRTAVMELSGNNDFSGILGVEERPFQLFDVDYYGGAEEDVLRYLGRDYEYIILDLGCDYERNRAEFLHCDRHIVIGTLCPWKRNAYDVFMQKITREECYKKWNYYALFGIKEDKKEFRKEYDLFLRAVPFLDNPFQLRKENFSFFQELL